VAEGAPLLREYRVKSLIEGSNPSLSAKHTKALIFQGFFVSEKIMHAWAAAKLSQSDGTCDDTSIGAALTVA
jgi:hypothetical protein